MERVYHLWQETWNETAESYGLVTPKCGQPVPRPLMLDLATRLEFDRCCEDCEQAARAERDEARRRTPPRERPAGPGGLTMEEIMGGPAYTPAGQRIW